MASHQVEQPKFGVHLRAREKGPAEAGRGVHAAGSVANARAASYGALGRSLEPPREIGTRNRDRGRPRGLPLPHHRTYGSVSGGSAD